MPSADQPPFDAISQDKLIDNILARLERERSHEPAYTLLLGSGFSAPLIPTAGQIVKRDLAWWLYWRRLQRREGDAFGERPSADSEIVAFERDLWVKVRAECQEKFSIDDGLPILDAENIGLAYRAIMSGFSPSGLTDPQWRRRYLRDLCARIGDRVNSAHIFLASILRAQERWPKDSPWKRPFCRTLLTTNFDPLLQRSLQLVSRLYFMSDRPDALEPPEDEDHDAVHIIYSHGSVHRYLLLNTHQEIEAARQRNASAFIPHFQRHGVLVVGYSGWNDATMDALESVWSFGGNLYWCDVHRAEEAKKRLSASACELLASKRGNAFYVPIAGADELMLALHQALGLGTAPGFIRDPIRQMIENLASVEVPDPREAGPLPRPLDTLKDLRDGTVKRLEAAQLVFAKPELLEHSPDREPAPEAATREEAIRSQQMAEAMELERAGRYDEAVDLWTKVIEDAFSPGVVRAMAFLNRAIVHWTLDRFAEAIEDSTAVLSRAEATPRQRAWAFYIRGLSYGKQKRLEAAIEDFTSVVEAESVPGSLCAQALIDRGVAKAQLGRAAEAIEDFNEALEADPQPNQRAEALYNRGLAYGEQEGEEHEIADLTAVTRMSDAPNDLRARALFHRGCARDLQGDRGRAIADFTAVLEITDLPLGQAASARVHRGLDFGRQGALPQAIRDFTEVIDRVDAPVEWRAIALGSRAWARFRLVPPDVAGLKEDAAAALSLAPDVNFARFNLALALLLSGDREKAIEEYSEAARRAMSAVEIEGNLTDLREAIAIQVPEGSMRAIEILEARRKDLLDQGQ